MTNRMTHELEEAFYRRADAHIRPANDQLETVANGKVSASMTYELAGFNAWVSAHGVQTAEQMKDVRPGMVEYFVDRYKQALEHNPDGFIDNFERYRAISDNDAGSA
jgi:hypothetical protein